MKNFSDFFQFIGAGYIAPKSESEERFNPVPGFIGNYIFPVKKERGSTWSYPEDFYGMCFTETESWEIEIPNTLPTDINPDNFIPSCEPKRTPITAMVNHTTTIRNQFLSQRKETDAVWKHRESRDTSLEKEHFLFSVYETENKNRIYHENLKQGLSAVEASELAESFMQVVGWREEWDWE